MLWLLFRLFIRKLRFQECLALGLRMLERWPDKIRGYIMTSTAYGLLGEPLESLHHMQLIWKKLHNCRNPLRRWRLRKAVLKDIKKGLLLLEAEGLPRPDMDVPEEELEKAKLRPWQFQMYYGEFLYFAGRKEEAYERFQAVTRLAPRRAFSCSRMGRILVEQGKHDEAMAYLRKALRPFMRDRSSRPYSRVLLAFVYVKLGKGRRARYHLWRWEHRELARGGSEDRILGACVYRALGLNHQGKTRLRQIFRFFPDGDLLAFLRKTEKDLGLEPMSLRELGNLPELYEAEAKLQQGTWVRGALNYIDRYLPDEKALSKITKGENRGGIGLRS
jgi:tetratricopeptide (TPR) repeat protein